MYHAITDDAEPGVSGYYRLNTPPSLFREHMAILRQGGFRGVTLSEGMRILEQGRQPESRAVVVTFDDGFRDFLTEAWPVLREHGFGATMFLPTRFIGDEAVSFKGRPCMTWAEIRELQVAGVEFGSHTVNHPELVKLPWGDVERELRESRRQIESALQVPVTTFAHPYAFPQGDPAYAGRFRELLSAAGYRHGVTTCVGTVRAGDDPLLLRRLPANGADDAALFRAKLHGAYDWLGVPQRLVKRVSRILKPSASPRAA
jgi:peptidoglycan/xylan/chitin deacetylase (PgdA/CDA1 family)